MSGLKSIRVVEIPTGTTADRVEELLNEPDHASYYLHTLTPQYAVFQLRANAVKTSALAAERSQREIENAKAADFLTALWRQRPTISNRESADVLLEKGGIKRSHHWVGQYRDEIRDTSTTMA